MKLMMVTLPLGLLLGGAGIYMMVQARHGSDIQEIEKPRHSVTSEMEKISGGWTRKQAPTVRTKDVLGRTVDFGNLTAKGPVFVYFIKDGCPCSTDAQPLFNHLRDKFKDKVSFVGVFDKDSVAGRRWAKLNSMTDLMLPDPKLEMIHAFKATNSAFSLLVLSDGTIDKMWPGYSRDYLLEMNKHLCAAVGTPETPFDTLYAPLAKTAGCYFDNTTP
jgi:peroxiredoxin